jgi:hypothetical protein
LDTKNINEGEENYNKNKDYKDFGETDITVKYFGISNTSTFKKVNKEDNSVIYGQQLKRSMIKMKSKRGR